jgi:MFS transporter, DHA1 family, chloramphenicol resistance protein
MTTADRALRRRLPLVVWVLAAGTFLMLTSEFVVAGLLLDLARAFAIDVPHAGLAVTVFAVGMIASPVMVLMTTRLPRRSSLAVLLVVFAIGHVVVALSPTFEVLLVARFATALVTGAFWAVAGLVAADAAGDGSRTRAIGVIQIGGSLATVIGVPIGALAGQLSGWQGPFWGLAVLSLGAAVLVARLVPHSPVPVRAPGSRRELGALRSGRMWLVLATCGLVTGGVLSVYSYISPLLTDRTGLPESAVPLALVVFGVAGLAGTVIASNIGDARPFTTVISASAVTLIAVVLLGLLSSAPVPTLIVFAVLGFTGLSANPVLTALAMRYAAPTPAIASALTPAAFNLGTAIGTGVTSAALRGPAGPLAPVEVGAAAALLVLLAGIAIALLRPRTAPEAGGAACAPAA